jgi:hypothetical protein
MSVRLALSLLLLCASLPLAAHDVRMLSANGDGGSSGCQDDATTQDDGTARPASAKPATRAVKPVKATPGVRHASDTVGDIRPPRWHSFLPGMFR